jgi:hypothetical protein
MAPHKRPGRGTVDEDDGATGANVDVAHVAVGAPKGADWEWKQLAVQPRHDALPHNRATLIVATPIIPNSHGKHGTLEVLWRYVLSSAGEVQHASWQSN